MRVEKGCRFVTHHINKVERTLITRTSICQAGSTSPFSTVDSSSPVIFSSCWSWILAYAPQIKAQHMFLCRLDYLSSPDNQWQTRWHIVPEQRQSAETQCWEVSCGGDDTHNDWQKKNNNNNINIFFSPSFFPHHIVILHIVFFLSTHSNGTNGFFQSHLEDKFSCVFLHNLLMRHASFAWLELL